MKSPKYDTYLKKFGNSFRSYKFRSIFFQYMKSIFAVFLAIILIFSVVFYIISTRYRKNESRLEAEKSIISYTNSLDYAMQRLETFHNQLQKSTPLILSLSRTNTDIDADSIPSYYKNLRIELLTECSGNSLYDSIYVYLAKSGHIITPNTIYISDQNFDNSWIKSANTQNTTVLYRYVPYFNRHIISIIKPVLSGDTLLGYICYNLRYSYFNNLFGNVTGSDHSSDIYLFNEDGYFIFSSSSEKLGRSITEYPDIYRMYSIQPDASETFSSYTDSDATTLCHRLFHENITLMYVNNYAGASATTQTIAQSLLIAIPVSIILCALLSAIISLRMYDYVFHILRFFDSPTASPINTDPAEIADIHRSILAITSRNQNIETEFAQKLIELKKSQTIALQTQINPHFLLNTLQMICFTMIREQHGDSDSVRIISLLSEILRSNLNTRDYLIPLNDEIKLTEKYLQLELIRNGNMFTVEWDIDPDTLDRKILRFMFQPILENSILHGLVDSTRSDKKIKISTHIEHYAKNDSLIIKISDNGAGMSTEKLDELQKQLDMNYMPETKGIGIMNVNMRLKLIFGEQAKLTITSQENSGTTITIALLSPPPAQNPIDNSHNNS